MNHAYGWMGGGMWIWTLIGALVVVLLVVAINNESRRPKRICACDCCKRTRASIPRSSQP